MGEKEQMPSLYPTSNLIVMEAHLIDLNTSVGELRGNDLNGVCNNGSINDHNFTIKLKKIGKKDWNSTLTETDFNSTQMTNYCKIEFNGPATAGVWEVQLTATDLNVSNTIVDLTSQTTIVVQDYFVFLEPVDPTSCDSSESDVASSCGFKFTFTKGQKVGLRPK
jgi:hypothetical protein